jgi:hypothetical protein
MQRRAVIVDLLEEGRLRRHLHIVLRGHIEGPVPADAEGHARSRDDRLGQGHDLALGQGRRIAEEILAQALALGHIEDGETLEEGHLPGLLAACARPLLLGLRGEAVGVDHPHPLLALADMAPASSACLNVSQPCEG